MRANIIGAGDHAFEALVYTAPDNRLLDYLQTNIENAYDKLQGTSNGFIESARAMYDKFNSSAVITASKAILHNIRNHLDPMAIYPLSRDNVTGANYAMQRYIMAHPDMRNLYLKQRCVGFDATYYDTDPTAKTYEEHTDYRRVMDGVLQFDDETGDGFIVSYEDATTEDDLDFMDKVAVLDTWDSVAILIAEGMDPSDPDDGEL